MHRTLLSRLTLPANLSWFDKAWLFAPIAVWFSYRPLLRIGQNETMYFELSVSVLFVALLALLGLPHIWHERQKLARNKAVWFVGAFVAFSAISLLWTPNRTRGILTGGMLGFLFCIYLASLARKQKLQQLLPALTSLLLGSALVMSALSLVQLFVGIWLDKSQTLLCSGCTALQFGFSRPNVFMIEPQFLGSLLVIPVLVLLRRLLSSKSSNWTAVSFTVVLTALFLTLSRGAIFAGGLGGMVIMVSSFRHWRESARPVVLSFVSLIACFLLQGSAAALNPTVNTSFRGAVSASINQVSLGAVSLPEEKTPAQPTTPSSTPSKTTTEVDPNFSGYVAESTSIRVKLSKLAWQSWQSSPARILAGVGLGGSGLTIHQDFPDQVNQREIVQNEFMQTLLELGLIGLLLFTGLLIGLFWRLRSCAWLWGFVVAFIVQWNFFSGYPNALHIYLTIILLAVLPVQIMRPSRAHL